MELFIGFFVFFMLWATAMFGNGIITRSAIRITAQYSHYAMIQTDKGAASAQRLNHKIGTGWLISTTIG